MTERSEAYEFVLETVENNLGVQDQGLWSSRTRVLAEAEKNTNGLTTDKAEVAISQAVEHDDLFHWHGLLAPADPEHLKRILERERDGEITRKIMVGQMNGLIRRLTEGDADGEADAEAATTEEAGV